MLTVSAASGSHRSRAASKPDLTAGQTATFSVAATALLSDLSWKKNRCRNQWRESSSYITPVTMSSTVEHNYVVVSNAAGSVTSSAAMLTVSRGFGSAIITTQPAS